MDYSSLPVSYVMYFLCGAVFLGIWFAISEEVCAWCGKQIDRITELIELYRQRKREKKEYTGSCISHRTLYIRLRRRRAMYMLLALAMLVFLVWSLARRGVLGEAIVFWCDRISTQLKRLEDRSYQNDVERMRRTYQEKDKAA